MTNHENDDQPLTIIELFQSQGCNSCPPANANVLDLVKDSQTGSSDLSNVLLLTFHVTYWDYLGWPDTFANHGFDQRQRDYIHHMKLRSAFTPQVVVNGRSSGVGSSKAQLAQILKDGRGEKQLPLIVRVISNEASEDAIITITPGAAGEKTETPNPFDMWMATYEPATINVAIKRGENAGRRLPHLNVVKSLQHIRTMRADLEQVFLIQRPAGDLEAVLLIQDGRGGPLVGAARVQKQ